MKDHGKCQKTTNSIRPVIETTTLSLYPVYPLLMLVSLTPSLDCHIQCNSLITSMLGLCYSSRYMRETL